MWSSTHQITSSYPLPRDSLPSTSRAHKSIQSISSPSSGETSESKRKEKKRHAELSDSEVVSAKKRKRDESDSVKRSSSGDSSSSRKRLWVAPNLRVRIIDTEFRRGKFYNSKVRNTCIFIITMSCIYMHIHLTAYLYMDLCVCVHTYMYVHVRHARSPSTPFRDIHIPMHAFFHTHMHCNLVWCIHIHVCIYTY